jgi:O-antigen/teichoic acid export membrane protein
MGMQNAVVRFLAIFRGEGDEAQIRGTILASLALVLVAGSVLGVGLWLVAEWLAVAVFHEPALGPVLRVFAVALPLHAMLVLLAACARGFRHMAYFSGMTHVLHPFGVLLLSSIAFLIGLRLEGALLGFTCATGLAALLMLYGLVRLFPTLWALRQGVTFNGKYVVPYAAKMFLADFTQPLLGHTDRLMLGYFSIARDVGIYSISAFIGSKLSFFQTMLNSIFAPVIADLHNRGKHDELVRLFQTVSKWTLLCTLPIFFACLFLGDFVLSLFGRDFQAGWPVLVVLASAHLIDIGVGPTWISAAQ